MTLGEEISAFLEQAMEPALECSFVWNGWSYPCVPSTELSGTEFAIGGKYRTIRLQLIVRKNVLPSPITVDTTITTVDSDSLTIDNESAPPRSGRRLSKDNRQYRVADVVTDPERKAFYKLTLIDPDSNR